jgi:hypothetical protein
MGVKAFAQYSSLKTSQVRALKCQLLFMWSCITIVLSSHPLFQGRCVGRLFQYSLACHLEIDLFVLYFRSGFRKVPTNDQGADMTLVPKDFTRRY